MSVIDIIDSNEFKNSTSTGFAVVDYSAVWCGPCKRVEPVFKELAQNNKKIKFLHIDIDHASETEGLSDVVNKIRSVPTFHFYRDGKIIDVLSGGNIAQLKSKVDSLNVLVATQHQIEMAAAAAAHKKDEKSDENKQTYNIAAATASTANNQAVIEINNFDEFKGYLLSGLAVVDYSATWCGPCKRLEPVFKELAQSNKNIKFLHIDIDHASETEGLNRLVGAIRSVPTFHFYRDGKVVDTLSGANIIQLKNKVDYLNSLAVVLPQQVPAAMNAVEKRNEEKQDDNKIEKKKAKTELELDEKREKFKSKSPDHHRSGDHHAEDNQTNQQRRGAVARDSSRKRADDTHHASLPVQPLPPPPATAAAPPPAHMPLIQSQFQAKQKPELVQEQTGNENSGGTGTVIEIEDSLELINLTQSGLAVIDYSATWCGPCKIVAPVFKELAQHYRAIKFLHIDIDHAAETEGLSELVDKIRSVPTFHFYRDGKIIDFLYGGNVSQLKIKIDALNTLGAMVAAANEKKAAMIAANNAAIAAANAAAHHQTAEEKKQKQTIPSGVQQQPTYQQMAAAVAAAAAGNHHHNHQPMPTAAAPPPPPTAPVPAPAPAPAQQIPQHLVQAAAAAPPPPPPPPAPAQTAPPAIVDSDADQKKIAVAAAAIVAASNLKQIEKESEKETFANANAKKEEISPEMINPIVDAYNSIDFINATATGLALVDYSAVWCPPCVRVQPILKDIAQNYKNIKFIHVDIDHAADTDLAELVDKISSVPTFHFYSDGRVIDTLQGANIAQLRSKVENLNSSSLTGPTAAAAALLNTNVKNELANKKESEKKKKTKSSSGDNAEKKSSDKKKKRKTKKKEAKSTAATTTTNPTTNATTTTKDKSNADPASAATTATINNSSLNNSKGDVE